MKRLLFVGLIVVPVAGCGLFGPDASQISKIADLPASTIAGSGDSVRVKVTDDKGVGVEKIPVTFAVTAGGGSISPTTVMSDVNGLAAAKFITGVTKGVNTATATADGVGTPAMFTVTSISGPAASIVSTLTLPANTVAGNGDSIRATVKDANGNGVPNTTVTFAVTAGGGSATAATATTNASGVAATRWITGPTVGANAMTATVASLPAVTFSATTIAGPAATVGFASRTVLVDPAATTTATASVRDANGNAVSSTATITYTSRNTAIATVSSTGVVTSVAPGSTFLIVTTGTFTDSSLVVSGVSGGMALLISDLPRFDLKTDTVFTITIAIDTRSSTEKIGSADIVVTWDPTEITYQSDAEPSSPPMTAAVNPSSASSGSIKIAVASAAGSTGAVALRKLTFKAAATAGKTGSLALSVTAANGAATAYTDLKPKTTAASYPLKTR